MDYNVNHRLHWYLIRVTTKIGGDLVEWIKWEGLPWHTRCKFDWYFKYRSALLQIKYPKFHIEKSWGNVPANGKTMQDILKNKISSKKGQINKFKSLLHQAIINWNQLFPIENEPDFIKAKKKIERLENELIQLQNQLKSESSAALR